MTPFRGTACGQQSQMPQKLKGLSVVLEASHAGTCCIIRTSLGRPVTKVHVTMGVPQGSVEGPLCVILLYALSITQAQKKYLSIRESLRWVPRGNTVSRLDLSDLCFVDDLVSPLIFWRKSQLSRFAEMGVASARVWSWRYWSERQDRAHVASMQRLPVKHTSSLFGAKQFEPPQLLSSSGVRWSLREARAQRHRRTLPRPSRSRFDILVDSGLHAPLD